jgi:hypothetical protein
VLLPLCWYAQIAIGIMSERNDCYFSKRIVVMSESTSLVRSVLLPLLDLRWYAKRSKEELRTWGCYRVTIVMLESDGRDTIKEKLSLL